MELRFDLSLAPEPRKKALVVSHERSGTHFVMNTLAGAFGYVAEPWVNLDFELGLDFHDPAALRHFFAAFAGKPVLEIFKSHHALGFFAPFLAELTREFHVLYVYRHPADVAASYLRFLGQIDRDEGPTAASAAELLAAAPRGAMLRYQKSQAETVLHRWQRHVEEWTTAGSDAGAIPIAYADLDRDFEATVRRLGERLGLPVASLARPARDRGVVAPGRPGDTASTDPLGPEHEELIRRVAGSTIERLAIKRG